MEDRADRLVDHLEASLESSEWGESRYHVRHALQYAKALRAANRARSAGVADEEP